MSHQFDLAISFRLANFQFVFTWLSLPLLGERLRYFLFPCFTDHAA